MNSRNAVRDDSQQLRDIQDLIAKLRDVNKVLARPVRTTPAPRAAAAQEAEPADAAGA